MEIPNSIETHLLHDRMDIVNSRIGTIKEELPRLRNDLKSRNKFLASCTKRNTPKELWRDLRNTRVTVRQALIVINLMAIVIDLQTELIRALFFFLPSPSATKPASDTSGNKRDWNEQMQYQ